MQLAFIKKIEIANSRLKTHPCTPPRRGLKTGWG
jgi:hypothetical protein